MKIVSASVSTKYTVQMEFDIPFEKKSSTIEATIIVGENGPYVSRMWALTYLPASMTVAGDSNPIKTEIYCFDDPHQQSSNKSRIGTNIEIFQSLKESLLKEFEKAFPGASEKIYKIKVWKDRAEIIKTLVDTKMFPPEWILKNFAGL